MQGKPNRKASALTLSLSVAVTYAFFCLVFIPDPVAARVLALSGVALILWLWESVPPFVPTLFLWAGIPLLLGDFSPSFHLSSVLASAADPVLALFLGGFVLARAVHVCGLDQTFASYLLRISASTLDRLSVALCFGTAFLSMWMSNVAAAALILASIRPLLAEQDPRNRRVLLLSLILGANIGGMMSPLGSGPNAIALAHVEKMGVSMSFASWMLLAMPLAIALMLSGLIGLRVLFRDRAPLQRFTLVIKQPEAGARRAEVAMVFGFALCAWLTEGWHHIPAAVVSLLAALSLFLLRILKKDDLAHIDGGTLLLIAGGLTLGRLLENSGLLNHLGAGSAWQAWGPTLQMAVLLLAASMLSALMSNTATATLLIPLAGHLIPGPSTPILIAMACSIGFPFVISTPPNAMVAGEGDVKGKDLMRIAWPVLILGWVVLLLSGAQFVGWFLQG